MMLKQCFFSKNMGGIIIYLVGALLDNAYKFFLKMMLKN